VTFRTGHMGYTFRFLQAGGVDAVESEFGDGRTPALCCPPAGWGGHDGGLPGIRHIPQDRLQISIVNGLAALSDRSRRPVRYANQLPEQIEGLIVRLKAERPHWGARKIRELLVRRLDGDVRVPAKSTIHTVLDRHGLVKRGGGPRHRACGTPLSAGTGPNDLSVVRRLQGRVHARQWPVLLSADRHRPCLALPAVAKRSIPHAKSLQLPPSSGLFRERGLPLAMRSERIKPVTKRGLEQIEAAVATARDALAVAQSAGDRSKMARASRDLRYWSARRATARS